MLGGAAEVDVQSFVNLPPRGTLPHPDGAGARRGADRVQLLAGADEGSSPRVNHAKTLSLRAALAVDHPPEWFLFPWIPLQKVHNGPLRILLDQRGAAMLESHGKGFVRVGKKANGWSISPGTFAA